MIRFIDLRIESQKEREALQAVLTNHFDNGQFIIKDEETIFEQRFKLLHGRKHAIGVKTGTDALVLAIKLLDLPKESYILTTSFSWLATSSSIKLAGHTPLFVDIDEMLNMDISQVESYLKSNSGNISALVIPHLHGNANDMQRIKNLRSKYGIKIVEDCAQSFGAKDRNGILTGTVGCISCFSFNPMKILPALGDGGMILFDNENYVERSYSLRHSGMNGNSNSCPEVSYNYRMDALQASSLNVRLDFHKEKLLKRRNLLNYIWSVFLDLSK